MKYLIFLSFLFLALKHSTAQRDFGLKIVEELCSEKYHGRGYVNNGHVLAANYIADQMKAIGLKPLTNAGYFQHFYMDINTFPSLVELSIDGKALKPGVDFIVDPKSGSAMGNYKVHYIESLSDVAKHTETLDLYAASMPASASQDLFVSVIVAPTTTNIDTNEIYRVLKLKAVNYGPVIWLTDKKFTFSLSNKTFPFPIFEVKKELFNPTTALVNIAIKNEFIPNLKSQNVLGYIEGKDCKKSIFITAHYDHLGRMGKDAYFPGANDNASGVAMLLYLATYFKENKPPMNIVFVAFGGEEAGLLGSKHFVENPLVKLSDIHFLLNLDILGTGEEGVTVVNGAVYTKQFETITKINAKNNYVSKVKVRGKAANSDHYFFSEMGVPSFFVYTMGGVSYYHDVFDQSSTLPLNEFDNLFKLFRDFILKV